MASRLKRWSLATAIAVVGVLVATLPPGPSPLSFVLFQFFEEPEPTGIDGHLQAVSAARWKAEWELNVARVRAALTPVRPDGASPIVLHVPEGGTSATVDTGLTSHVAKLWRVHRIPTDRVRTVLVTGAPLGQLEEGLPRTRGVCFARLVGKFETRRRTDRVAGSAGRCAIESRHGTPGEAVRRWVEKVGPLVVPEVAPHVDVAVHSVPAALQWPEWVIGERPSFGFGIPWWVGRAALACGKGREEFCQEAVGLGGWTPASIRNGRFALVYPGELPAALLTELGPERFGELWRSDASIPESFERLTGTPFDPWAMAFVQRRIGRVERPTALGLGGWLGWLFWMGLLTGWSFVRVGRGVGR